MGIVSTENKEWKNEHWSINMHVTVWTISTEESIHSTNILMEHWAQHTDGTLKHKHTDGKHWAFYVLLCHFHAIAMARKRCPCTPNRNNLTISEYIHYYTVYHIW